MTEEFVAFSNGSYFAAPAFEDHAALKHEQYDTDFMRWNNRNFMFKEHITIAHYSQLTEQIENIKAHPRMVVLFYTDEVCPGICSEIQDIIEEEYKKAQNITWEIGQLVKKGPYRNKIMPGIGSFNIPELPRLGTEAIFAKAGNKLQAEYCIE